MRGLWLIDGSYVYKAGKSFQADDPTHEKRGIDYKKLATPFQMGVYLEPLRGFVLTPAYGRSSKLSLYLQPPMAALSLIRLTYFSNLSLSSCSEM